MLPLTIISLATLITSLILTNIVRSLAASYGIVDRPDGSRKLHGKPTPLWGGIAVYMASIFGLLLTQTTYKAGGNELDELFTVWAVAAGIVCLIGGLDDCYDLSAKVKLLFQIVAVLPIIAMGYYVDRIVVFGIPLELGLLGIPLTIFWLIGCINALNLIDGMDGLATIVGLSTIAMMGVIANNEGNYHVAIMAVILTASLFGFLIFNLPPASIFLGDSGSMLIGLTVGLLGIQGSLKTSATLGITAPAVIMTLPIFDVSAAVVRRKLTGRKIYSPDRMHIHHRLLDRGWTPWQVLCLVGAICLTTGAAATAATILRRDMLAWITAMSLVVLLIRLKLFGYEEFAMLKNVLTDKLESLVLLLWPSRKRHLKRKLKILDLLLNDDYLRKQYEHNPNVWNLMLKSLRQWGIHRVEFKTSKNGRTKRVQWCDPTYSIVDNESKQLHWHKVSMPGANGGLCELKVAGLRAIEAQDEAAIFTATLMKFGNHFATYPELIFGPMKPYIVEENVEVTPLHEKQRKAA